MSKAGRPQIVPGGGFKTRSEQLDEIEESADYTTTAIYYARKAENARRLADEAEKRLQEFFDAHHRQIDIAEYVKATGED